MRIFPANSSPLHGGHERRRCALSWRAQRGSTVVFERIRVNNLVLPCSLTTLIHRGWPARPRPAWQGVEMAVQTGCIRAGRLWEAEKEVFSLFENVCVLFCPLSQRSDTWAL